MNFWEFFPNAPPFLSSKLENRELNSDPNKTKAFENLLKVLKQKDIIKKIKAYEEKSEREFNVFFAQTVLEPLSGGKCDMDERHLALGMLT